MKVWGQKARPLWLFYLAEIKTTEVCCLAEAGPSVVFLFWKRRREHGC
jgi:hypothetical protein